MQQCLDSIIMQWTFLHSSRSLLIHSLSRVCVLYGWWCKWKVGCLTSPLSDFRPTAYLMRSSLLCCAWTADDGDGATTQAAAAWHESKMHILSNTTGNVAIENFKKILIDDFCIPRDTTARHYHHHSCYWNMGEFFTNHWSERNQDGSLFVGLFVIGWMVVEVLKKMRCQNCELSKNLKRKE